MPKHFLLLIKSPFNTTNSQSHLRYQTKKKKQLSKSSKRIVNKKSVSRSGNKSVSIALGRFRTALDCKTIQYNKFL